MKSSHSKFIWWIFIIWCCFTDLESGVWKYHRRYQGSCTPRDIWPVLWRGLLFNFIYLHQGRNHLHLVSSVEVDSFQRGSQIMHKKNQMRLISLCFHPQARFQQHNRWTDSFSLSHCWTGPFAGRKCCSGEGVWIVSTHLLTVNYGLGLHRCTAGADLTWLTWCYYLTMVPFHIHPGASDSRKGTTSFAESLQRKASDRV